MEVAIKLHGCREKMCNPLVSTQQVPFLRGRQGDQPVLGVVVVDVEVTLLGCCDGVGTPERSDD